MASKQPALASCWQAFVKSPLVKLALPDTVVLPCNEGSFEVMLASRLSTGMVQEVLDRRNAMTDPAIANIDQALMVFSLAQPPFEPPNATRFLVSAEAAGIPVTLVLNKADLLPPDELDFVVSKASGGFTVSGRAPHLWIVCQTVNR